MVVHHASQQIHQRVTIRPRVKPGRSRDGRAGHGKTMHERGSRAYADAFGKSYRYGYEKRPDAILTSEQLWQIYRTNGDVRASVDSIARRCATTDRKVEPTENPAGDEERYQIGLHQAAWVNDKLTNPAEDETWQTFWTKTVVDALVFFYGVWENVYGRRLTKAGEITRGTIREFLPIYTPSTHPVVDETNRIIAWDHYENIVPGTLGAPREPRQLDKCQIGRLHLSPNNRSQYGEPLIETIVREVTTLVRASERTMYAMDRNEIPTGFLVLTGHTSQQAQGQHDEAEQFAGNGHRLRVIHTMGTNAPASWVKVEQDFHEIAFRDVVEDARQVVWRVFGVTPIEMGKTEGSNRANSQVQVEVGDSHLVEPLLESIAQIVNAQMIPLLIEAWAERDPSRTTEVLCRFGWDTDEDLTPDEEVADATAAAKRLEAGITTINEERTRRGLPRVEGGDVIRINGVPINEDPPDGDENDPDPDRDPEPDEDPPEGGDEDGDVNTDDTDAEAGEEDQRAAMAWLTHARKQARDTVQSIRATRNAEDLPSEWQDEGKFADMRTIDLTGLHDLVVAYRREVLPLWSSARERALSVAASEWSAGKLGGENHLKRTRAILDELHIDWAARTSDLYLQTAELGTVSARNMSGNQEIGRSTRETGEGYRDAAMTYLRALLDSIQARIVETTATARAAALTPESDLDEVLETLGHAFDAEQHRVDNWSGKLVELAHLAALAAMLETETEADPEDGAEDGDGAAREEWWVAWEHVGDANMCNTCAAEGSKPIRRASSLATWPGGDTECGARCRCVTTWWTRAEVENGTAIKL